MEETSRSRLAWNAMRFGMFGAMLLYAFLPPAVGGAGEDPLGLRAVRPGPWTGALAGLACVLGGVLYAAGPAWRSTLRPPSPLVHTHFYSSAIGAMCVFGALMMSSWSRAATPAQRLAPYRGIATAGSVVMMVATAIFVLNVVLAIRNHRSLYRSPPPTAGT